jgi:hypothetical protein
MNGSIRGWLKNPERKARQQKSLAFTDEHVQGLTNKIDQIPHYCKKTLGERTDHLLRQRDKAIVSTLWTWFKRGHEVLSIKRKDVVLTERQILVTFHVQKKSKRFKVCAVCDTRSGFKSKFCRECKANLQDVEVQGEKDEFVVTKRKTLKNKFVQIIVNWLTEYDKLTEGLEDVGESWFFPALRVVFNCAFFKFHSERPMTVQNLDAILQKLDSTITSSFFRYFATEKYLSLGYLPHELKEVGDWSSSKMPELYAERFGLTPVLRKWSEDVR